MTFQDEGYVESALEALLFVSDEPVAAARLAEMLDMDAACVTEALERMRARKQEDECGVQLREVAGGWQLVTHMRHHDLIERYVRSWDTRKLSAAAMETLAIIAYMQPVTRAQVSAVRGVTSDSSISSLVEKGLVREAGSADTPGNPTLYATTRTFLEKFGLASVDDMPDLAAFAPDEETERLIRDRLSATRDETALTDEEAARLAEQMLYDDDADGAVAGMIAAEVLAEAEDAADASTDPVALADAEGDDAGQGGTDAVRAMMRKALESTAGVVEKIDLDSLVFDIDDE